MISRRGLAFFMAAAVLLIGVSGCTPQPPRAMWRVSPVIVDDEHGDENDVSFLLTNLSDDTAGGFWGESEGSWLRVAADETTTRFTYSPAETGTVTGLAAASETTLYVLRRWGSGPHTTTVELFDTADRSTQPVLDGQHAQSTPEPSQQFTADGPLTPSSHFGPITSIDVDAAGNLFFVERVYEDDRSTGTYLVRRLGTDRTVETLAGLPSIPTHGASAFSPGEGDPARGLALGAIAVDISAGDPRGIVVATEHSVFQITEDGTAHIIDGDLVTENGPEDTASSGIRMPVRPVDASAAGAVVLPLPHTPATRHPIEVTGGSRLFRQILAGSFLLGASGGSREPGLAIIDDTVTTSAALRYARQAVWIADDTLIALVPNHRGDESIVVRIEMDPERS